MGISSNELKGRKILFTSGGGEGHFNPLTGLAKHLQQLGADVRWYATLVFSEKLQKLGIPHFPFEKALVLTGKKEVRDAITDPIEKLNYDFIHSFILRSTKYYEDILKIRETFPFDLLVSESSFTVIPFVRQLLNKPVLSIGIVPLPEMSVDLAPLGMALPPAKDEVTRAEYAKLNDHAINVLFKNTVDIHEQVLNEYGIKLERTLFPNLLVKQASLYLQIGAPGFDYQRSDIGKNIRFIGALLPYQAPRQNQEPWFDQRLTQYKKIVLVTQGTVEKNTKKLTEPTLEAFRDTDVLVIATTSGSNTEELRAKYNANNFIIEDYIPFNDVMPYANVYITNGGYGGALLSISHRLPMVAAGLHEGKNEICARIAYFNYGIDLKTETPTPEAIRSAAEEIMNNPQYKENVTRLQDEMSSYSSKELCVEYALQLLSEKP